MFKQIDEEKLKQEEEAKKAAEEEKAKQVDEPNPNDVDLNAEVACDETYFVNIENARLSFRKILRIFSIIRWTIAIVCIGLVAVSWLYIINKIKWLCYVLTGVAAVIFIAYYFINKMITNKKMEEYLKAYYGEINAYAFSNGRFSNVNGDVAGKIEGIEFTDCGLYSEVSTIGSRNVVNFRVDDKVNAKMCDLAAQKSTAKRLIPLFIGKYLIADNTCTLDSPIYIYLTGNSRSLPPNNLASIRKVINSKKLIVQTEAKNYEKFYNSKVRALVSKIITNNILIDASIVIAKGKTYVGLGYDDCLMVLPYEKKMNPAPSHRFKEDMNIIADILSELAK